MAKRSASGITSGGGGSAVGGSGGGRTSGTTNTTASASATSAQANANPAPTANANPNPAPTAMQNLQSMDDAQLAALVNNSKRASMPNQLADRDDVTQKFVYTAGLNEKPQVLDNAQFSQFMKDNNLSTSDLISRDINPITYKNNSGTNVKMTADDVADMMMYSRYNYIGGKVNGQALGAGTYFDHVNGGSTGYGGRNSKTVVGVLNPATARPISSRNLASQARQFAQTHPQFAKAVGAYNSSFSGGKNNMSIYALAMGYNVIIDSGGYTNVIDRSAIVYRK